MNPKNAHWMIVALVNVPVYLALGRLIFEDWEGFLDSLRHWSDKEWIADIQKEWRENRWETSKLPTFLAICLLLVVFEHLMFSKTAIRSATQALGV